MGISKALVYVSLLVVGFASSAEFKPKPNQDCFLQIAPIKNGKIVQSGPEDGYRPGGRNAFYEPLELIDSTHYAISVPLRNIKLAVFVDLPKNLARFNLDTPDGSMDANVQLSTKDPGGSSLEHPDVLYAEGSIHSDTQAYGVSCAFGLSARANAHRAEEQREMDRLGPPEQYEDANAVGLETLKKGSVIEITQDFKMPMGKAFMIEQYGLMEDHDISNIPLSSRFARVQLSTKDWYKGSKDYPRGLKMEVVSVEQSRNADPRYNDWSYYEITLKTSNWWKLMALSPWDESVQPILKMTVTGRRSGHGDVKIPQFMEILSPLMKVTPL